MTDSSYSSPANSIVGLEQAEATPDTATANYSNIASKANAVNLVQPENFADADKSAGMLSTLAQAFQTMFQQGNPVAEAQNNMQRAQLLQNVAATPNASQNQVATAAQNTANATQGNTQQAGQQDMSMAQSGNKAVMAAQLQQQVINAQITHANAMATIQKQQLAQQAKISQAASLEAQQNIINTSNTDLSQIQMGQQMQNFNNLMKGIGTAAQAVGAVGGAVSGMGKNDATNPNSANFSGSNLSQPDLLKVSGYGPNDQQDVSNDVTEIP